MNNTVIAPFFEGLRQATSQSHKDLESLPISASIINPNVTRREYASYLCMMRDVVADTEINIYPVLEGIITDIAQRRKLDLIDADLAVLGIKPAGHNAPLTKDMESISPGFALGIMYVTEGSSLGGRVILKNITPALGYDAVSGASYFSGYGAQTGSSWKNFLQMIGNYETDNNCSDEIIEGAIYAFGAIKAHFIANTL